MWDPACLVTSLINQSPLAAKRKNFRSKGNRELGNKRSGLLPPNLAQSSRHPCRRTSGRHPPDTVQLPHTCDVGPRTLPEEFDSPLSTTGLRKRVGSDKCAPRGHVSPIGVRAFLQDGEIGLSTRSWCTDPRHAWAATLEGPVGEPGTGLALG